MLAINFVVVFRFLFVFSIFCSIFISFFFVEKVTFTQFFKLYIVVATFFCDQMKNIMLCTLQHPSSQSTIGCWNLVSKLRVILSSKEKSNLRKGEQTVLFVSIISNTVIVLPVILQRIKLAQLMTLEHL